MSSEYGTSLKINVFGASHAKEIGVTVKGFPSGEEINQAELLKFMSRRKPGQSPLTTPRVEDDLPIFESGITDNMTDGQELRAVIQNTNTRSGDYENLRTCPRPAHADYCAYVKYDGKADMRGGGHFSARLTAPLCIAGGMCLQMLNRRGIKIGAHIAAIGGIRDDSFPLYPADELFDELSKKKLAVINDEAGAKMSAEILAAKQEDDSVGGIVECAITGVPVGVGDPMFDGIENRLAAALFGIPAVKGVEFGNGFECASLRGSQNNDPFIIKDGKVQTETNNHGGSLGGISTGMPIVFRVAFKPTPSIGKKQRTVDLETMTETTLEIKGRHDPCVVIRAVPVVEAVAATVITDMLLSEGKF